MCCCCCLALIPRCKKGHKIGSLLLKIIAPALFVLGIFEMVGLGFYIDAVSQTNPTACCGFLSSGSANSTQYVPGAECLTSNIEERAIDHVHHTDTNGNIWCAVNGTICGSKTLDNGETKTLSQCFSDSGHNVSSLCSAAALDEQAKESTESLVGMAGFLLTVLIVSTVATICDAFGCCKKWKCCGNHKSPGCCTGKCPPCCKRILMILNAAATATVFAILFTLGQDAVDNIINDGYMVENLYGEDIGDAVDNTCDINPGNGFIWVNVNLEVSGYLASAVYEQTSLIGLILGFSQVFIITIMAYFCGPPPEDDKVGTSKPSFV